METLTSKYFSKNLLHLSISDIEKINTEGMYSDLLNSSYIEIHTKLGIHCLLHKTH